MKVLLTDYLQPDNDLERALFEQAGIEMAEAQCRSPEEVIAAAQGAHGLIIQYAPITREVIQALPDLGIISYPGIGVDMVDLQAASEHGVWVANVPDANYREVAAHALAMCLSLVRQLPALDASVRRGEYHYAAAGPLRRPGELSLGVLGLGRIGREFVRIAAPVFGPLAGFDPFAAAQDWPQEVRRAGSIEELFAASDLLSVHVPMTEATRGLVGRDLLGRMRPGSFLVNVSRGQVVDLPALLQALDRGHLRGAGLDVLPQEPPAADDAVLRHPRVLLSPHAAFYSLESDAEARRKSVENITTWAQGARPLYPVVEGEHSR